MNIAGRQRNTEGERVGADQRVERTDGLPRSLELGTQASVGDRGFMFEG